MELLVHAELAEMLRVRGTGPDTVVAAIAYPKSERHGPLHVAAATKYLEMCKVLVQDNPNATDADGILYFSPLL